MLERFKEHCLIDKFLKEGTVRNYWYEIRKFLRQVRKNPLEITDQDVRQYLVRYRNRNVYTYSNVLKTLKIFFRFLGREQVVKSFQFPKTPFNFKEIPSKEEIVRFYNSLENVRDKTLLMMLASSGKRLNEILSLKFDDIDFKQRMIRPSNTYSRTKKIWYSFYNEETERVLIEYLDKYQPTEYLIPMQKNNMNKRFAKAVKRAVKNKPERLERHFLCHDG